MGNNLKRGSDRENVFPRQQRRRERERKRRKEILRVREAVIMVEEDQETGSAGWEQISVGDLLKLT